MDEKEQKCGKTSQERKVSINIMVKHNTNIKIVG